MNVYCPYCPAGTLMDEPQSALDPYICPVCGTGTMGWSDDDE